MEAKKSKKADLRNKQGLFLQVGMLLAFGIVFASFQWTISEKAIPEGLVLDIDEVEFDMMEITRREEPKKEMVAPKKQAEFFEIIEDEGIDTEVFIEEYTEDLAVEIIALDEEPEVDEPEFFTIVEDMPKFPGGDKALLKFLVKNTEYPEVAREHGIQGRVFVSFIINKKGVVENVQIARGVDPILDKEALRVVSLLPKWTPGKQRGKAVNVSFNVPINFQLN